MAERWIVPLDEGDQKSQPLLGGKGAGLAELIRLGIPTVPGFVITTEAWGTHTAGSRSLTPRLWDQVQEALAALEARAGKTFGSRSEPLVVSVRSSPTVSMPGQLKTILNVGLNSEIVEYLAQRSSRAESWYDAYRRLIRMYGVTVHNIPSEAFGDVLERRGLAGSGEERKKQVDAEALGSVIEEHLSLFRDRTGEDFPQDPYVQLERSVAAVFDSWFAKNVVEYRAFEGIPDDLGTAAVVQMVVFGNLGPDSGSGVVFSRNPATGEKELYGEYLRDSQGEELVAGLVTPRSIAELAQQQPKLYDELEEICTRLEAAGQDAQDVEFTVEEGRLWILQARSAKRTPLATVRVAVEMAHEGLISREEAVRRVDPQLLGELFDTSLSDASSMGLLADGIESSPGAVSGRVALDRVQVEQMAREGIPVILVREQTSADDAAIMPLVSGILTQHGGATSHAAVVARGLGKPCVVGCEAMEIDLDHGVVRFGAIAIAQGDEISIDGTTGKVYRGGKEAVTGSLSEVGELKTLLSWADEIRHLRVLVDASTPAEIEAARELGAEGVGVLRTERLYYDSRFLPLFCDVILTESSRVRKEALEELRSLHREEFRASFEAARGLPVTVRLLNAPLDHFLPSRDALLTELAELRVAQGWSEEIGRLEEMLRAVDAWRQTNPEYGVCGARLAATVPEVVKAQVLALLEGASEAAKDGSLDGLRILVPFLSHVGELDHYLQLTEGVAEEVADRQGTQVSHSVGATIETTRAALVADQLASRVDFLCIDSDGLTASVFSSSREGTGKFLPPYKAGGIIAADPFSSLDEEGVGFLIQLAVERARSTRADVEIGVFGSYCDDPAPTRLFHGWGLDSVSCHLSYLLAARLSAAQAVIG